MGLAPSEFWRMHPREFWWWVEAKAPHVFEARDMWAELYELMKRGKH